jgi:hypothetical protein
VRYGRRRPTGVARTTAIKTTRARMIKLRLEVGGWRLEVGGWRLELEH